MTFQRGDRVEVMKQEEGFEGSYYLANIMARISSKEYIVQYRTLVNDDGTWPLREILSVDQLRPEPPEVRVGEFGSSEVVDAYVNDGWWVGQIVRKQGLGEYLVFFECSDERAVFSLDKLRVHQDWVDGGWRYSRK